MKTFKTSSGFVFKFYSKGEICKVVTKCDAPMNSIVKILNFQSEISRNYEVIDLQTNKKYVVNSLDLEIVTAMSGEEDLDDRPVETRSVQ